MVIATSSSSSGEPLAQAFPKEVILGTTSQQSTAHARTRLRATATAQTGSANSPSRCPHHQGGARPFASWHHPFNNNNGSDTATTRAFLPFSLSSWCRDTTRLQLPITMTASASAAEPVLTARAIAAGLVVGSVLCFSNTYFGLQTGWVTMGSLQSAILGYGLFQGLGAVPGLLSRPLNAGENVIVQTTAVATATMPLAAGLVGIIPALGLLTPEEHPAGPVTFTPWQLLAWCSALAFFGVFVAVPLRYQTIIRERLRFPSGTATASVIRTLHGLPPQQDDADDEHRNTQQQQQQSGGSDSSSSANALPGSASNRVTSQVDLEVAVWAEGDPEQATLLGSSPQSAGQHSAGVSLQQQQQQQWARALRLLLWSFALSGAYSLAAAWVKPLRVLKVFDWLHLPAATAWGWVLQPSAGYIGQGMIMGPKTAWSMMAGAVTGWAILGPMAKANGWAPGPIKDVQTGAAGWLMWLGLALLLGDCFSELALLIAHTVYEKVVKPGAGGASSWGLGKAAGSPLPPLQGSRTAGCQKLGMGGGSNLQQQGLLRSRNGSKTGVSGTSLELSRNSSSGNVTDAGSPCSTDRQHDTTTLSDAVVVPVGAADGSSPQLSHHQQEQHPAYHTDTSTGAATPPLAAAGAYDACDKTSDAQAWLLSAGFWVPGLLLSTVLATAVLSPMLDMPFYEPLVAVIVALLVALLAVRALGQTDLNPVSGVGKVSQLVFAVVSPGAVLPNLVAGAIAEAGAQQAGDLMQDFKTAHLLGVPASSQLVAMLLGSAASVPLSVAAYLLYTHAWQVPGPELPAPTAQIWLDMAKLVNGGHLPEHIGPFCAAAAAIAAALPVFQLLLRRSGSSARPAGAAGAQSQLLLQQRAGLGSRSQVRGGSVVQQAAATLYSTWRHRTAVDWVLALLPSGVGFAVGMYLAPSWTLPRLIGSVVEQTWLLFNPVSHAAYMMVAASGLVLGEGCASVVTAVVKAAVK